MTKTCTACRTTKPLEDFYRSKRGKYGRESRCIPCLKAMNERYRLAHVAANPEVWAERYKQRAAALPRDKKREYDRRWRLANPEKYRESIARSKAKRPEFYREAAARWARQNPEAYAEVQQAGQARRLARVRGAAVCDFTRAEWEALMAEYDGRCAYCGIRPQKLTQDHVIAIAKGGSHTRSNIVPACLPCNQRKGVGPPPPLLEPVAI